VLVVGAGPVGLMAAVELARRGADVMVVERRDSPAPWAKAVGMQPRTLEILDAVGVARSALDAAVTMRGQIVYVNGEQVGKLDLVLPGEVPYGFVALPQYETERVLAEHLRTLGQFVYRGTEFVSFSQDDSGVTATVLVDGREQVVRAGYLVGCDGAHSLVRKGLGLSFEGDAFPEEYMLADVEVDWSMPVGYGIRSTHQTAGVTDDALVCIPLPGRGRYRMSALVPPDLATPAGGPGEVAHGLEGGRAPELHHIQAVLDRLGPEPTTAGTMRWSSVFRISHRLVDRYSEGRVFVAGDAAHIHPPTGAQGMNTGIQDAYNLGWKLALAVQGQAADGLLESYHAERHPIGEEVVGRTTRQARTGIGAGETDIQTVLLREAQLLVGYPDSPVVGQDIVDDDLAGGPAPGSRAPDASGLRQDSVAYAIRWQELLRHPDHTLLVWARDEAAWRAALGVIDEIGRRTRGKVKGHVVVPADAVIPDVSGATLRDSQGNLAAAYGISAQTSAGSPAYLIRPDGYVAYRTSAVDVKRLTAHLGCTLRW
jgi:2-polyprenyl-6-methoxyphenol hydroxylase-like FAD-dependent oxidoreductase